MKEGLRELVISTINKLLDIDADPRVNRYNILKLTEALALTEAISMIKQFVPNKRVRCGICNHFVDYIEGNDVLCETCDTPLLSKPDSIGE